MKWHCTLREGLIKSFLDLPDYNSKWGRFPPSVNVDQLPLPFSINCTTTYEEDIPKEMRKYHKVWVANPGARLEKRQRSVQLAFTSEDDNLIATIIFRGTGKRISHEFQNCYYKSVNVYWKQGARTDTKVCADWRKNTLAPTMKDKQDYILFCDKLEGQTVFRRKLEREGGIVWCGMKNATDF